MRQIIAIITLTLVGLTACGANGGHATTVTTANLRPMPCAEHEVYVWQDYPRVATCMPDTDHEGHMGGHE